MDKGRTARNTGGLGRREGRERLWGVLPASPGYRRLQGDQVHMLAPL